MKLGEFFIQLGVKGDTKKLDEAISKMEKAQAKEKTQLQFKEKILRINKLIAKATKAEQVERLKNIKAQIRDNYVNKVRLDNIKTQSSALKAQQAQWAGMLKGVTAFVAGVTAAVIAVDRLANSTLKANQLYTNFSRQTGIPIKNLNKMIGLGRLSGMNMTAEQVASDLGNLQQKIFGLARGEDGSAFAQIGINPMGMKSDQFITLLRKVIRARRYDEASQTRILDDLGLSREWLNVIALTDEEYANILEKSQALQLTEEERKQLVKYNLIQQKNNIRWELAKQKLIIAMVPLVTKIMEIASNIAMAFAKTFDDKKLAVLRDIVGLLGLAALNAQKVQKALMFLLGGGLLKNVGGSLLGALGIGAAAKTATKAVAGFGLKSIGKGLLGAVSGPLGWILLASTVVDIYGLIKDWFNKDTQNNNNEPPIDTANILRSITANSNMVNNFYNNPVPQRVVIDEITYNMNRYLAETNK